MLGQKFLFQEFSVMVKCKSLSTHAYRKLSCYTHKSKQLPKKYTMNTEVHDYNFLVSASLSLQPIILSKVGDKKLVPEGRYN